MNCSLPCRVGRPILRTCVGSLLLCLAGCGSAHEVVEVASLSPDDLLRWSRPAGGLIARIEGYHDTWSPDGRAAFVRIKNVGRTPLAVPVGEPDPHDPERGHVTTRLFELQLLSSKGWRGEPLWAIWPPSEGWAAPSADAFSSTVKRLYPTDIVTITLRPGQSVLVYLSRTRRETTSPYTAARVVIRRTRATGPNAWSGMLSTPPLPIHDVESGSARGQLEEKVPFPDHFPQFIRWPFMGANLSGNQSYYTRLCISKRTLLQQMRLYPVEPFIAALEKRLAREKNIYMRILIASIAADHGSEKGKDFLLRHHTGTDYMAVRSMLEGVAGLCGGKDPPPRAVEILANALKDKRKPTGLETIGWSADADVTVAYIAEDVGAARLLADLKARGALPASVRFDEEPDPAYAYAAADKETAALRKIKDEKKLLKLLKEFSAKLKRSGDDHSGEFHALAVAAVESKFTSAVPILMDHLDHSWVFHALRELGDPRPVPALRRIVTAKGKWPAIPANESDGTRRKRLEAARLALAALEEGDPIPRLGNLLLDMSMEASARRHVCDALEGRRDPRLIPYLVRSIKTDHDGPVMCRAMEILATFKNRAAFDGLVECLDNPFRERRWYKLTPPPDTWRGYVAGHLREMTGVAIGADSAAWKHWWDTRGRHLERFE